MKNADKPKFDVLEMVLLLIVVALIVWAARILWFHPVPDLTYTPLSNKALVTG